MRRRVAAALALTACVALGACGSSGTGGGSGGGREPYRIGYVVFLSGPASVYADAGVQGVALARQDVNKLNTAGRPVEVVTADDATDPATAAQVCNRLVTQDHVDAIVGYQTSAAETACLPIATRAGIPYIHAANNPGTVCAPNYFTTGEVPNQQVAPLLQRYLDAGKKRFYLIGSDYNYPRGVNAFARKYIESHGGTVVGEVYAPLNVSDISPYVSRVAGTQPDVVLEEVVGAGKPAFIRGLRQSPSAAGATITSISMEEATQRAVGSVAKGVVSSFSYFADVRNQANDAFKAALAAKFGDKAETPGIGMIWSYDGVEALAHAVKDAGSTEGSKVIEALKRVSFPSPRGTVTFTPNGNPELPWRLARANGDGTFTTIASGPPVKPITACK